MPRKESMEHFAERRGKEAQARLKARDNPPPPGGHKLSRDAKATGRGAWLDGKGKK